jgi:hypothetical protein
MHDANRSTQARDDHAQCAIKTLIACPTHTCTYMVHALLMACLQQLTSKYSAHENVTCISSHEHCASSYTSFHNGRALACHHALARPFTTAVLLPVITSKVSLLLVLAQTTTACRRFAARVHPHIPHAHTRAHVHAHPPSHERTQPSTARPSIEHPLQAIWHRGRRAPPTRLTVAGLRRGQGGVRVWLAPATRALSQPRPLRRTRATGVRRDTTTTHTHAPAELPASCFWHRYLRRPRVWERYGSGNKRVTARNSWGSGDDGPRQTCIWVRACNHCSSSRIHARTKCPTAHCQCDIHSHARARARTHTHTHTHRAVERSCCVLGFITSPTRLRSGQTSPD